MSLPSVILFLTFSWFRSTLPHWTGPAYLSLILLAAFVSGFRVRRGRISFFRDGSLPRLDFYFSSSFWVTGRLIMDGLILDKKHAGDAQQMGDDDISLDLYGWKQMGHKFQKIAESDHFFQSDETRCLY